MVRRAARIVTHSAWPHRVPVHSIGRNSHDGHKCTPSTPEFSSANIWRICVASAGGLRNTLRLRAVWRGATWAVSNADNGTSLSSTSAGWLKHWGSRLRSCLTFPRRKSNPPRTLRPQAWAVRDAQSARLQGARTRVSVRPQPADGDSLRVSLAGPSWMTGLRRPTWTPPWLTPAITGRWRSGQDFPRWIVLSDRFTAANLNLALARPGHQPPLVASTMRPSR